MNFRFGVFSVEADCVASGLEPALCPPHHAHDLARRQIVEVGVGKGRQFTPPFCALLAFVSRYLAATQPLHTEARLPWRVFLKSLKGRSSPHALQIFVSISLPPEILRL